MAQPNILDESHAAADADRLVFKKLERASRKAAQASAQLRDLLADPHVQAALARRGVRLVPSSGPMAQSEGTQP